MIHIITSNNVPARSIKEYVDNFELVHMFKIFVPTPFIDGQVRNCFHIYHQPEMDLDQSEYVDNMQFKYSFFPSPLITSALDNIADSIQSKYEENQKSNSVEEMMVLVACKYAWNQQVCTYLNQYFSSYHMELECLNIYKYMKCASEESLKKIIQNILNSTYVYPEEPISFAYALNQAIASMI